MNLRSSTLVLGGIALLFVIVPLFDPQPSDMLPQPSDMMERKTRHAQEILRYLAMGDLASVAREAKQLDEATVAAGFEGKSDLYAAYGDEFLNQVRGLRSMAESKNISGTYYYFNRLTGVCFSCHEHERAKETPPSIDDDK